MGGLIMISYDFFTTAVFFSLLGYALCYLALADLRIKYKCKKNDNPF